MSLKSEFGQGAGKISTIENLIGDNDFIDNLAKKIAKDNGSTGIYTKRGVDGNLARKANTADIYTKHDADGKFATIAALGSKADSATLAAKANTADVYTKNDANTTFLKTGDLATKVAEKAVVDVLVPALATVGTDDDKKVYTKTEAGSTFLKTGDLATKVAEKAVVDVLVPALATGADNNGVYTKKGVDDAFVKTLGLTDTLKTEVVKQPVVDALIPELAKGADDKGIYTKKGMDDALKLKADTNAIPAAPDLSKYLETSKLGEEVKKSAVVDALIPELAKGADNNGVYTKKGVDSVLAKKADTSALADKANTADIYTKIDADGKFATIAALGSKANSADLAAKANAADVYTKNDANTAFVKTADLGTKVAEKDVVEAITASPDFTNKVYIKAAKGDEVYTKTAADTAFVKTDGFNATDAGVKAMLDKLPDKVVQTSQLETLAVAGKVLDAKDGNKSILVEKLGGFLDATDTAYGAKNGQTAKVFLGGKGLKGDPGLKGADGAQGPQGEKGDPGLKGADGKSPSAAEIAADSTLQAHVAKTGIRSPEFKEAIQEEMSQPKIFDIPSDPNAPISADW